MKNPFLAQQSIILAFANAWIYPTLPKGVGHDTKKQFLS